MGATVGLVGILNLSPNGYARSSTSWKRLDTKSMIHDAMDYTHHWLEDAAPRDECALLHQSSGEPRRTDPLVSRKCTSSPPSVLLTHSLVPSEAYADTRAHWGPSTITEWNLIPAFKRSLEDQELQTLARDSKAWTCDESGQ